MCVGSSDDDAGGGGPPPNSPVLTIPQSCLEAERLRLLLRAVFVTAGGQHEDWDEYDRMMARQTKFSNR